MTKRVILTGTYNLRDLGGISVDGGTITPGQLLRGDGLHRLEPAAQQELYDYGVRTVIDLRDDRERAYLPDRVTAGTTHIGQPVFPDAKAHVDKQLSIAELTELIYRDHGRELAAALRSLIDAAEGAVLFHCTAGKDRTGAVSALLLAALGATDDTIVADYAASEQLLAGEWVEQHISTLESLGLEVNERVRGLVATTPPEVMRDALAWIRTHHGSVDAYLDKHGFDAGDRARLHERFVTPVR